jgi:hypothetical protein
VKGVPTPEQLAQKFQRIRLLVGRIERDYRWVHEFAHGSPGNSRAGEGRSPAKPNPTQGAALSLRLDRARNDLRAVEGDVDAMIASLGNAAKTLRRYDHTKRDVLGLRQTDRLVTDTEVQEARDAQARREGRGEGWGAA